MARIVTFPNGLRLVLERRPREKQTAIVVGIGRGTGDEPASYAGALHLIEHLVWDRYPWQLDVAREIDRIGALHNASTSEDATMFYCTVPGRSTLWGLEMLADLVQEPKFTEGDLEQERETILEELHESLDTSTETLVRLRNHWLFNGHSLGRPILGQPGSLKRLSFSRVMRFWHRLIDPRSVVVSVVGSFDTGVVTAHARQRFGHLGIPSNPLPRRRHVIPRPRAERCSIRYSNLKQVNFLWSHALPGYRSRSRYALMLLANILGGRLSSPLFHELRERGLIYSVDSEIWLFPEIGYLTISSASSRRTRTTDHEREKFFETLSVIREHVRRYYERGVPAEEFELSQQAVRHSMRRAYLDPDHAARSYAAQLLSHGTLVDRETFVKRIIATKHNEVNDAARRFLDPGTASLCAVGPLTRRERERLHAMFPERKKRRSR